MPVYEYARIVKRYKLGADEHGTYKVYGKRVYLDGAYEPVAKKLNF